MAQTTSLPRIIQGGMGVGVSTWRLARAVCQTGQLGVVSGTALAVILARRLQLGDPDGHMRQAMSQFPLADVAQRTLDRYFIPGGKNAHEPFRSPPLPALPMDRHLTELTVLANFVEVFLARQGHDAPVGINYLEKVQLPTLASLYGAMLAGVDYVLMGAGIPRSIPGILDRFARGEAAELKLDVEGALPEHPEAICTLDPWHDLFGGAQPPLLKRPKFLPIVSSAVLAMTLARKSNGAIDGFIVESRSAGGHNAPPRGELTLDATGQPIYGERDLPDLAKIRSQGLPFWLAGSYAEPLRLAEAMETGATGVQIGTAFAFCEESGITPEIKRRVIEMSRLGQQVNLFTDPAASPTGFPFKVLAMPGTLSQRDVYDQRRRLCDLGFLRRLYRKPDGSLGYRCPAEPLDGYQRKGGNAADAEGRKCLCNGLAATAGMGQIHSDGHVEKAVITAGEDVAHIARFLQPGCNSYSAADVVRYVLNGDKTNG